MNYYILEFDDKYNCLIEDDVPFVFEGISMNLGLFYDNLPRIKVKVKEGIIPNSIPNQRRYLYFDNKILKVLESYDFSMYQSFDIDVFNEKDKKVYSSHQLINILNVVQCIDREESVLVVDEEEEDDDLNIEDIMHLKLDESKIESEVVFRLGGFETLLVFREDIVKSLEDLNCTGIQFINADGYKV